MAAGAIIAAAAAHKRRQDEKAALEASSPTWRAFAERHQLTFSENDAKARDGTPRALPRVSGAVSRLPLTFEIFLDAAGWAHTRAFADAPAPQDVEVAISPSPAGVWGKLRALFAEDLVIGDERFDDLFVIRGAPPAAAVSLLDEGRRAALVGWLGHNLEAFRYERGRITLVWLGVATAAEVLDMALETLAHAATFRFALGEGGYRS